MPGYIPEDEDELVIWGNDHSAGVNTHGATVGLSPADITDAANDAAIIAHGLNGQSLYGSKSQEVTAYKDILLYSPIGTALPGTPTPPVVGGLPLGAKPSVVPRRRQTAERLKAHPNYTEAIGQDCRIIAPAPGPAETQPVLQVVAETDFAVRVTFAMHGHDQIEIQSQVGLETTWTTIAFDTNAPYLDGRDPVTPNTPEQRRYRGRFRDNDVPFGTWSDTVSVTAQA